MIHFLYLIGFAVFAGIVMGQFRRAILRKTPQRIKKVFCSIYT